MALTRRNKGFVRADFCCVAAIFFQNKKGSINITVLHKQSLYNALRYIFLSRLSNCSHCNVIMFCLSLSQLVITQKSKA